MAVNPNNLFTYKLARTAQEVQAAIDLLAHNGEEPGKILITDGDGKMEFTAELAQGAGITISDRVINVSNDLRNRITALESGMQTSERLTNKITTFTDRNIEDDTSYPSAKLVYDSLKNFGVKLSNDTSLSAIEDKFINTDYPSNILHIANIALENETSPCCFIQSGNIDVETSSVYFLVFYKHNWIWYTGVVNGISATGGGTRLQVVNVQKFEYDFDTISKNAIDIGDINQLNSAITANENLVSAINFLQAQLSYLNAVIGDQEDLPQGKTLSQTIVELVEKDIPTRLSQFEDDLGILTANGHHTHNQYLENPETQSGDRYLYLDSSKTLRWKELQVDNLGFANVKGSPSDNAALNSALNAKQDKLTAGSGIYIDQNTGIISATGGVSGGGASCAEELLFLNDLKTNYSIGNYNLDASGQATIPSQNKSLKEVFDMIFVNELDPSVVQPSTSIYLVQAETKDKEYEVGTRIIPEYEAEFDPGLYQFGPHPTGVSILEWIIQDSEGERRLTASGSFDELLIKDNLNYDITAKVRYSDGTIPVTNTGKACPQLLIEAATTPEVSTQKIKGYRNTFYGCFNDKTLQVTPERVRNLTKSNKGLTKKASFNVEIPVGAMKVIIAYPSEIGNIRSIIDVNAMQADIKDAFTLSTLQIPGYNNYRAIPYSVYTLDYAKPNDTVNTYKVTL